MYFYILYLNISGRLDPNSRASRKLITLTVWSIISQYFNNATMYSDEHEECQECLVSSFNNV